MQTRFSLLSWEGSFFLFVSDPCSVCLLAIVPPTAKFFFFYGIFSGDPAPFEKLFLISWENNRDCHITMPGLSLKTMEVQIKGDQWNKRFRTVQVFWLFLFNFVSLSISKNGKVQKRGKVNLIGRLQLSTEKTKQEENDGIVALRILRIQVRYYIFYLASCRLSLHSFTT